MEGEKGEIGLKHNFTLPPENLKKWTDKEDLSESITAYLVSPLFPWVEFLYLEK